ncbi:MAG: N-acetylmuramoyl-L-alanine amidase [Candidatus Peregrinibacteria bacterium]|nr:N-acetylmuramoyl-L-alanine amidase [Candidatus Peregrinibacteria bacterium]MCB9807860.1 N-acetylmuramoyl-L-alanine amidase [Candidatus Peribacteria bacterium]
MRKLLFSFLSFLSIFAVSSSELRTKTFFFNEPVDAMSIQLPTDDTAVSIMLEDGWHRFAIEKEFDPMLMESDMVMFGSPVHTITLRGQLSGIALHPIRVSSEPIHYAVAATTFYRSPRIISRSGWGADESFLYKGPEVSKSDEPTLGNGSASSTGYTSSKRIDDCELAQKQYPQDFVTTKTITHDANGNRYRWAKRYSPQVKLLVVHHTAQKVSGDPRPAVERVRALYDFHANSRGWGDVGYHYLIDEEGGIYEGRSGGDSVVGGHVYCGNVGTMGIALLGNFELEQPTQQQVQSLQWLLDQLATKYDIDLNRSVVFKGKSMDPIVRHKDLISTECPGYYMSNVIAQVRSNVKQGNLLAAVNFPKLASNSYESRTEQRLTARLEQAGQALSRNFYRAKRLVRTAARINPEESRLKAMQDQLDASTTNIQRVRAARQARLRSRTTALTPSPSPSIRIRLSYTGNIARIATDGSEIRIGTEGTACVPITNNQSPITSTSPLRIGNAYSLSTITSWNTPNNRFRGVIECRVIDGELILINELPLEDYLKGLAEEPDTEPPEKQKAFAVAARSYAAHYLQPENEKFPGMPYHGSDSPAVFQKYSGVTFEEANPLWVHSVSATANTVLMKEGSIVKAAYFSSDDGRTRSPEENGWKNFPFADVFASKPDPWCKGNALRGHGVGMSGCGANGQAAEGKTFREILEYYYPGTLILDLK